MNEVPTNPTGPGAGPPTAGFCGHCGGIYDGGAPPPSDAHRQCQDLLALEPPRYCAACGRRLKVQVSPLGWWAACSRHGRSEAA